MKNLIFLGLLLIIVFLGNEFISDSSISDIKEIRYIPSEELERPKIFFCPKDNCSKVMLNLIQEHDEIKCALFDLKIAEVIEALVLKNASVVVDNDYYAPFVNYSNFRKDSSSQLSHNKFCVFDSSIVLTGSFNPTYNGAYKNNNNVVILQSKYIAENYLDEFNELWSGVFGKGEPVKSPIVKIGDITVENYFCPEDNCKDRLLSHLEKANKTIHFMVFSFTDTDIVSMLIQKSEEGINVTGVMESQRFNHQYNVYKLFNGTKVDVFGDNNRYIMHHKVFIVDESIVITGSYNPTGAGNSKNDENILILHDKEIGRLFIDEFYSLI